jgi:hypothetical protein
MGKLPLRDGAPLPGRPDFQTSIRGPAGGVFATEREYWQTVHLGGDGWEAALEERRRAEKELWRSKVRLGDSRQCRAARLSVSDCCWPGAVSAWASARVILIRLLPAGLLHWCRWWAAAEPSTRQQLRPSRAPASLTRRRACCAGSR